MAVVRTVGLERATAPLEPIIWNFARWYVHEKEKCSMV